MLTACDEAAMPGIFHKVGGRWRIERLAPPVGLLFLSPARVASSEAASAIDGSVACVLMRIDPGRQWAAIVPENLRLVHNGHPVTAGMRVLAHRDSLALEGREAVYFSTEEAARIEPFVGTTKPSCPRCRLEILSGQPTVKCPRCNVVHHEMDERGCWTYAPTCALCPQPTALDTGLQWSPESL